MRALEGHNKYVIDEPNTGTRAYLSAGIWGISFALSGVDRTNNGFCVFSLLPEEGTEVLDASESLLALSPPTLEDSLEEATALARERSQRSETQAPVYGPSSPYVQEITEEADKKWSLHGTCYGQQPDSTDYAKLGGLTWTNLGGHERAMVRIEKVDGLIFTPSALRIFAAIVGNKPVFEQQKSLFQRLQENA